MFTFNLNIFSRYRAELMGVATLMIIVCHSPHYVTMPGWLATILGNGGTGCDVFLFLSGMGMFNSYMSHVKKGKSIISWYWKRYVRIFIPCAFIITGMMIYHGGLTKGSLGYYLVDLSGFLYLTGNLALWYVSCALLLYLLTPLVHNILTRKKKWVWLALLCFCSLLFWYVDLGDSSLIHNWQFCISRFPSYFIGYTLAIYIKKNKESNMFVFVLLPLLLYSIFFVLNHTVGTNYSLFWTQGIPIMTVSALFINWVNSNVVNKAFSFLGSISLESYATNVLVLPNLNILPNSVAGICINPNNLTFYFLATVICLMISVIVNRISKNIINNIS